MRRTLVGLALLLGVALGTALTGGQVRALADASSATPQQLAALDAILARPEFHVAEGRSALDRLLDPVRAWLRWLGWEIMRVLAWLFDPIAGAADGQAILYGIVGVALVILIGVALMLHRLMRGTLAVDATLVDPSTAGPPRAADELTRARAFALAGDARRAVHHQYRAVLLRLDERDHLPFDGTLTNRELVPRLLAVPALADPFAALVARFDRLWYGQTDCSSDEYAAFAELSDRVWQAAGTVAPAHPSRREPVSPRVPAGASSGAR